MSLNNVSVAGAPSPATELCSDRPVGPGDAGIARNAAWWSETRITWLSLLGITAHLAGKYGFHVSASFYTPPLVLVLAAGGIPLLYVLLKRVKKGQFGSDLLAGLSITASIVLGEYLAGSIVVLMLAGGTALENYATRRASSVLSALAKRIPSTAHKISESGIADIDVQEIRIGDRLAVFPHEICPVDGTVAEGNGTMDESYLTGEPFLIQKIPGANVFSGAANGSAALTITANRLPVDSRYARIMRVMREAEMHRPRMKRIADRLGAWYTVVGVAVAAVGWIAGNDPRRFLAVLVIATPCPLLLAVPVAIVGAISLAASRGIIIKNPAMLEQIASCRTVIFDKTGTLTYGKPSLAEIICNPPISSRRALQLVASLEQYSRHPLAGSVLEAARREGIELEQPFEISEKPGEGLSGQIGTSPRLPPSTVRITGRRGMKDGELPQLPPADSGMECILLVDGAYAALLRFHDIPRSDSRSFVRHLGPRHQVNRIMLVSGDREAAVRRLAEQVGINEVLSGKSPEEKVAIVRKETEKAPTLFLGDGINDAPAMQAATVGVAFGGANDITAEAADAVVLETSLGKVDELIHIGRRMRSIALQSAIGGMALSMVGMAFAAAGLLSPVAGAIAQEVVDAAAILNALRMALPAKDLRDADI